MAKRARPSIDEELDIEDKMMTIGIRTNLLELSREQKEKFDTEVARLMSILDEKERENRELYERVFELETKAERLAETREHLKRKDVHVQSMVEEFNRNFTDFLEANIEELDRKELVMFLYDKLCEKSDMVFLKSREIEELKCQLHKITLRNGRLEQQVRQLEQHNSELLDQQIDLGVELNCLKGTRIMEIDAAKSREKELLSKIQQIEQQLESLSCTDEALPSEQQELEKPEKIVGLVEQPPDQLAGDDSSESSDFEALSLSNEEPNEFEYMGFDLVESDGESGSH